MHFRWLYTWVFVIDGNFTAVHLRQKNPENDVFLSDGTGYMTHREPYLRHLQAAKGWVEVSLQGCSADNDISPLFLLPSPQTMSHAMTSMPRIINPREEVPMQPELALWLAVGMESLPHHLQVIFQRENSKSTSAAVWEISL
jgi:hypothetical protein